MIKHLLILVIMFGFTFVQAQNEYDDEVPPADTEEFVGFNKKGKEKKKRLDQCRLRVGGAAGFLIRNSELGFNISPIVGYQVVEDRLEVGGGISYDFYRFREPGLKYTENTVGGSVYLRAYVWEGLFAQFKGVVQKTYIERNQTPAIRQENIFGGFGYQYPIADRAFMNFGLEINLIPYDLRIVASRAERVISPFFQFQFCF